MEMRKTMTSPKMEKSKKSSNNINITKRINMINHQTWKMS